MKIDTLIFGASVWSSGLVINGCRDLAVISAGAVIGEEYFDCYRPVDYNYQPETEAGKTLKNALAHYGLLKDFYGASPFIYKLLLPYAGQFRLWHDLGEIRRNGEEWEVTAIGVSGPEKFHCRRLIDATPECLSDPSFRRNNIRTKKLNALIHCPPDSRPDALPAGFECRNGRREDEFVLSFAVDPASDYPAAREAFLSHWLNRPSELSPARIFTLAKTWEIETELNHALLPSGIEYFNPASFSGCLNAIDHAEVRSCS